MQEHFGQIPLLYFLRVPNFGDRLNANLVKALTSQNPFWSRKPDQPHILGIGSVLSGVNNQARIWGSGVMDPDFEIGDINGGHVFALRGPKSYEALRRAGVPLGDVPLGDPAMLAPSALGIQVANHPRHLVGLVAHYVDRDLPAVRSLLRQDGVADINVHDDPCDLIAAMADCQVILSSSLHGLILAEALGLPSLWIKAGDGIAGGSFKFEDWFGTTRNPQRQPYVLEGNEAAHQLAALAEHRDHTIDLDALAAALPVALTSACGAMPPQLPMLPFDACRSASTPVFLISFNRGNMLQKVVAGLKGLTTPVDIIVHDNGSNDPATLAALHQLEMEGITVYRYAAIENAEQLNQVNESVARYFDGWAEPIPYVVSDCDIDVSVAAESLIEVLKSLLNRFPKAECVGPMLRIRDIPKDYPLRNRALNRHIDQFWKHEPKLLDMDSNPLAYQPAPIDTTFALHRAGEPFRRLKSGLRVYEPYEALHLDWYVCAEPNLGAEVYATTSHPQISHWNNFDETQKYKFTPLEFDSFYLVRSEKDRSLRVLNQKLSDLD